MWWLCIYLLSYCHKTTQNFFLKMGDKRLHKLLDISKDSKGFCKCFYMHYNCITMHYIENLRESEQIRGFDTFQNTTKCK